MWHLKSNRKLPPLPWTVTLNFQLMKLIKRIDTILKDLYDLYADQINQIKSMSTDYEECIKELKDNIKQINHENQRLRRSVEQHDGIVAKMLGENEDLNLRLSECLKVMREDKNENDMFMCECCCVHKAQTEMLKCTSNHYICKICVDRQCRNMNDKLEKTSDFLKCCSIHECNGKILASQLCQTEEGNNLIKNYHIQEFAPILYAYVKKFDYDQIDRNIMFLKSDGTFRALQCKACNYGPILYEFCEDLEAHHGQEISKNVFINNSCPKCKTFHANADDFLPWNGFS